jgi:hypothetical protein
MLRIHLTLALALVAGAAGANGLQAQSATAGLAVGPAFSGAAGPAPAAGGAAAAGVGVRVGELVVLGEGTLVALGGQWDWEGSARMILLGGAAGISVGPAGARPQPYVLARVATGADPREGDQVLAYGIALGARWAGRPGLYAEARADRWDQRGARHFVLPAHVLALMVGVSVR